MSKRRRNLALAACLLSGCGALAALAAGRDRDPAPGAMAPDGDGPIATAAVVAVDPLPPPAPTAATRTVAPPADSPTDTAADASTAAARVYGTAAALGLLEELLRDGGPEFAPVRGDGPPRLHADDFDAAVVLVPFGERLWPDGMTCHHLGDFVPVLLPPRTPTGDDPDAETFVPRRWLPLLELCMPAARDWRGAGIRPVDSLRVATTRWLRRPDAAAVVSLGDRDLTGSEPVAAAIAALRPAPRDFDRGGYPHGIHVYLLLPRPSARSAQELLDRLRHGCGRERVRRLLS